MRCGGDCRAFEINFFLGRGHLDPKSHPRPWRALYADVDFCKDPETVCSTTMWAPSYPLLVPALQAMDFQLMGAADQNTIAVQYWFLLAGFVGAVAGLLNPHVPSYLVWPFLATL